MVSLGAVGQVEVFRFRRQTVRHHAKTVWTFPAVAIRELQRFRPDIQHRQLIGGILVSRFVDRHRLPRSRCRELFGQMLLQFRFQFQFQRSESFGTALPALCCPWVAVPPEPPDLRFVQPIIVHQRRCLIASSVISRKIPHSAAIAGVQTHPVQPQRGTKSNIQRILLLHLAFFRSGQRAGAFAVFGQAPFFHIGPQFSLRHLYRKVHDQSLPAPVEGRDQPPVAIPFKFPVQMQFLALVGPLLRPPVIFSKTDLPASVLVFHDPCPLPFFFILARFSPPHNLPSKFFAESLPPASTHPLRFVL